MATKDGWHIEAKVKASDGPKQGKEHEFLLGMVYAPPSKGWIVAVQVNGVPLGATTMKASIESPPQSKAFDWAKKRMTSYLKAKKIELTGNLKWRPQRSNKKALQPFGWSAFLFSPATREP